MNSPINDLERLRRTLASSPQTLEHIWHDQHRLWQELNWEQPQIRLWLSCLPEISVTEQDSNNPTYRLGSGTAQQDDLGTALLKIIEQVGGRLTITQIKSKLPHGITATDQMIRTTVNRHPELTITGPLISRK